MVGRVFKQVYNVGINRMQSVVTHLSDTDVQQGLDCAVLPTTQLQYRKYKAQATRSCMEHINDRTTANVSQCGNLHESRFKTILFTFRLIGLPIKLKSVSRINTVYNATIVVCFYITAVSLYMDTFVHRHQLEYAMKKLRLFISVILAAWMHLSFSYRKRDIEHLLSLTDSFTWEELPIRDPDTGYLTKAGYIPIIQVLTKNITALLLAFDAIQFTVRVVMSHDMVLTTWYPFNVSVSPIYEIANLTQAVAAIFMVCYFVGFQGLYATLVCVACSQLEKIRLALLDIRQKHVISEQNCNYQTQQSDVHGPAHPSDEQFRHMQEQLNNCIRHHQQIKRYMEALEDTMNLPLCGILFMFLSIMCFDAFSAVTSWGDHADISQAVVVYIFATGSVCSFCRLGNDLSEQAEIVRDAAWGCDWVGTPVSFQRCLVFIIATANKGFTLTAGKFVPISNSTMINMMNQSISFFMFLLHMKDKNTNHGV